MVPAILKKLFWQNLKCFPSLTTGLRWLHVVISWYHRSSLLMQTLLLPYPTALVNNQSLYIPVYSLNDQRKNKVRKVWHSIIVYNPPLKWPPAYNNLIVCLDTDLHTVLQCRGSSLPNTIHLSSTPIPDLYLHLEEVAACLRLETSDTCADV